MNGIQQPKTIDRAAGSRSFGTSTSALLLAFALSTGLGACGGNADTNLESAFCAGLGAAAAASVTATVGQESAPAAALGDRATEVKLASDGAQNMGSIVFTPDEVGPFAFGLDEDVPFVIVDSSGQEIALAKTVKGSETCAELAVRHTAMLELASYTITFGPTDATSLKVVAEESDDDLTP